MKLSELLAAGVGGPSQNWDKLVAGWQETLATQIGNIATVWTVYQIGIVLAVIVVGRAVATRLEPRLEAGLRQIKGQPGLLRILVVMVRRIDWMLIAALLWAATLVLLHITWPSNSYIVRLVANLALAWAVVATVSRLIRNRLLAGLFAAVGWTVAALNILGLLGATFIALDAVALQVGSSRVSLLLILKSVVLLCVLLWAAAVSGDFLDRRMRDSLELSPTMQVLSGKLVRWALVAFAVATALGAVGVDLTALTVLSGAVGIGIGFGLQKLASNLISGVIILTDRSIKPGDTITIGDMRGTINTLNARYVSVLTLTGAELLVPNERFVTETVVNWSFSNRRMLLDVPFGVDYRSDPNEVRDIAVRVAQGIRRVLPAPGPGCQLRGFGDSALEMTLIFWIDDPENGIGNVKSEVLFGLWAAFKEAGISIPYPHREVIVHQAPGPGPQSLLRNGNGRPAEALSETG